jgi:hypothetical protein
MPTIVLSQVARDLIRAASSPDRLFRDTATARPDGLFDIPVSDDVMASLTKLRHPGESDDDLIVRLFSMVGKHQS